MLWTFNYFKWNISWVFLMWLLGCYTLLTKNINIRLWTTYCTTLLHYYDLKLCIVPAVMIGNYSNKYFFNWIKNNNILISFKIFEYYNLKIFMSCLYCTFQADRLRQLLLKTGCDISKLSQQGTEHLNALASLAVTLELKDGTSSRCI